MNKGMEEKRSNNRWRDWIDIVSKFASIIIAILMAYFAYLGYDYNKRVDDEKRIKELTKGLAPDERKEKVFSAYVLLRFQFPEQKASKDKNVQKLLSRQIFILILQEIYPDRNTPKALEMLERLQIIDYAINDRKSSEVIFAEMLFQNENKKAIEEFTNFIKLYPKHWLTPWAYFSIASIYSVVDPPKAREYATKALNEARRFGYEDGEIEEMSKRLKERIGEFKGEQ